MDSSSLASAMYEDLGISSQTKPTLIDIATTSVKSNLDKKPMSSRRRPLPPSLIRGAAPPSELPMTPRPPLSLPSANPRPSSVPRSSALGTVSPIPSLAVAEAASDAEILRLRFALGELQAKYDRQGKELAELRGQQQTGEDLRNRTMPLVSREPNMGVGLLASTAPASVLGTPKAAAVEQACQTDERVFTEQLDVILKDAAQKGKDLRKSQETVRMLRAELEQEKVVSEQHREQAERLELQLREVQQRQQRADSERTLAEWHSRNGGGCGSRSCTPRPGTSRVMKAWGESGGTPDRLDMPLEGSDLARDDGCLGRSSFDNSALGSQSLPLNSLSETLYRNRFDQLDDAESAGSDSEEVEVYHPPPSRRGFR